MNQPDPTYVEASGVPANVIKYALQPVSLVLILWYWINDPDNPLAFAITIGALHMVLWPLELSMPARPGWLIRGWEKARDIVLVILLTIATGYVAVLYDALLREPLSDFRQSLNLDVWPHQWPLLVQVFVVFFCSEFIWYWFHRAEHRWHFAWRLTGHGTHHSFKRLGALNFGLNHPLEFFLLVLPAALIELTFGVGLAAAGAAILGTAQASIAHCNLDLNTKGIGWLLTTNRYHLHHHSVVLAESNTNYGCSAIIWDRLFGTFADAQTREAGSGPTEPSLWQKVLMPIREPVDTAIAPD